MGTALRTLGTRALVPTTVLLLFAFALFSIPCVSGVARAWFALQCHRMPERSFDIYGLTMPVCARCTGIYAGVAFGAVVPLPIHRANRARAACIFAALGFLMFVSIEHRLDLDLSNMGRFLVGSTYALPFGVHLGNMLARRQP